MRVNRVIGFSSCILLAAACAQLEKEKLPAVSTAGPHAVGVGKTIQVTAVTANGMDASYTWESATPAVATVDGKTGVVTGVTAGEAVIQARGDSTAAVGTHAVVVLDAAPD